MMPSARAVSLALGCAIAAGCAETPPVRRTFHIAGRDGAVTVPKADADRLAALSGLAEIQYGAAAAEFDLSDRQSDLSKINRVAGSFRMQVSFNTFRALDLVHYYSQLTQGGYDLALLGALEAWGIGSATPPPEPPTDEELAVLREHIGPHLIQFFDPGGVALLSPAARLAPMGLQYAYGVDLALVEARRSGFNAVLFEWDRYARALGRQDPNNYWSLPIRNPFDGPPLGTLRLPPNHGLAVIGLRDQTVTIAGETYGGIIDPRSLRPAQGTCLAAVRAPTCLMAHVLAHALIVLGMEEGARILPSFPEADVLIMPDRQPVELWATEGWIRDYTPAADAPIPRRWGQHPTPEKTGADGSESMLPGVESGST